MQSPEYPSRPPEDLFPPFSLLPFNPRHYFPFLKHFFENITAFLEIILFFKTGTGSNSRTSGRAQATLIGIFIVELAISSLNILGLLSVIPLVLF
jgi:hypothetical protein